MAEHIGGPSPAAEDAPDTNAYNAAMAHAMQEWSGYLDWTPRLQAMGVLTDPYVTQAFRSVRRYDFLPPEHADEEGYHGPVQIGFGQTNSQPKVVARMTNLLHPRPGESFLDFGSGSGWTTALLAAVVTEHRYRIGRRGRVIGTEVIPELVEFGGSNLAKYRFPNAQIIHTADELGYPEGGPYHGILASARLPEEWVRLLADQLHPRGGRLIAPVSRNAEEFAEGGNNQDLVKITRRGDNFTRKVLRRGVGFVPAVRP